jgi:two-component system sensor histidine kinase/response regulator
MCSKRTGGLLDLEIALSHVGGDRQLLAELSTMFLQDYPRLLGELKNSIIEGDGPRLERAAHTLKGRLAFFGVRKARAAALELEAAGRMKDFSRSRTLLTEFEGAMNSLLSEFESLSRGRNP